MSILVDESTHVLVQGITGREGMRATHAMLESRTAVSAGVTPGKGGITILGVPVYDSVAQAVEAHPEISATVVYVPPAGAKDAAFEAISNGIKLVNVITEDIAISDTAEMIEFARKHKARIVGPSSVGIFSPGKARLGVVGGPKEIVERVYKQGNIGVISKSGGMTNETAWVVRQAGLGQSTVVGMGGDVLVGSDYVDLLKLFEEDDDTHGVVFFGELGGSYEEQIAWAVEKGEINKPVAGFIAGRFASRLPSEIKFGHAGAIVEGTKGTAESKMQALKEAGVLVAETHDKLGEIIKTAVKA